MNRGLEVVVRHLAPGHIPVLWADGVLRSPIVLGNTL